MDCKPESYWEHAGEVTYSTAMFSHPHLENHINSHLWQTAIDISHRLGLNNQSYVLDLGCGDGTLTNVLLAKHFKAIDGFDLSAKAIERASKLAPRSNICFKVGDVTTMNYSELPRYDGAFLWGILHHVKAATPSILCNLRNVSKRIVVLEPNGGNLIRKLLERTSAYKAAGEESFTTKEIERLFNAAGYRPVVWKRINLFPNFTPKLIFKCLKPFEPIIESTPLLRALCTANMWGFEAYE